MTFGLGYNWTDAKNHCFTSVKIEPRPKITILPQLGIQNVNAIFFVFYNATFTFSLLWTRHQPSTTIVVQPPFTLLWSFVFHSSRLFIPRSHYVNLSTRHRTSLLASLCCAIIPPQTNLLHCLLVSRATVAPVPGSHRCAPPCSPCVWWFIWNSKNYAIPSFLFRVLYNCFCDLGCCFAVC